MLSVGVDLECSDRFDAMDTPAQSVFYQNVFTLQEQQTCAHSPILLAVCFAAKEAVSKMLGTGLTIRETNRVTCHSIEMTDIISIEPGIRLMGGALQEAQRLGFDQVLLRHSITGNKVIVFAIGASGVSVGELKAILKTAQEMLMVQLYAEKATGLSASS